MSLSALIRQYHIAEIPINWYGRTWGSSHLSIGEMGRRYLSTLIKLMSERFLIADDIMEERLLERTTFSDRLTRIEDRLEIVEEDIEGLRKPRRRKSKPRSGES